MSFVSARVARCVVFMGHSRILPGGSREANAGRASIDATAAARGPRTRAKPAARQGPGGSCAGTLGGKLASVIGNGHDRRARIPDPQVPNVQLQHEAQFADGLLIGLWPG